MKKIKHVQQPKKAQVHIGINNPIETRKEILTTALSAARLLKDSEELRAIKEKKLKTIRKLSRIIKEIKFLEKQLSENHLPQFSNEMGEHIWPHHVTHELKKKMMEEVKEEAPKKVVKEKTENDKLKDELDAIERKLKSL